MRRAEKRRIVMAEDNLTHSKEFVLGNVWNAVDLGTVRQRYLNAYVDARDCYACWARYLCGGRCLAEPTLFGLPLQSPYRVRCEMTTRAFEDVLGRCMEMG
ncbi:MAG: hypothetical protein AB1486_02900 [Planctomycetota bacterium]